MASIRAVEPEPHRWEHVVIAAPDPKLNVMGWQQAACRLCRGMGQGKYARGHFRRHEAQGDLRDNGVAHDRALLWRLGVYGSRIRSRAYPPAPATRRGCLWAAICQTPGWASRQASWLRRRKDPYSGNLHRIQIVKGWLDAKGELHEHYDVVWSGERKLGADGKLPAVGNTVDVKSATWTNSIGSPELIGVWSRSRFRSGMCSFHDARVIEIPTPRWTAYEAVRFGITMPAEVPMTATERAYTSPIWYTP